MKYYKATEEGTTDVNGAWKPLKPLSEGFEFVGEDQEYDNLIGRRAKERRDVRKQGRASGLTRKEARKTARQSIPTNKPARREAYLALVKVNFRGFAYKLDAIINGTNTDLKNKLKEKWRKWGEWNQLIDAVNKGKDKKPFVCGANCRKKILDTEYSNLEPVTATIISASLALAGVVISSMGDVVQQGQIGKQQRDAIEASEKQSEDEFNNLSPEEKQAILDAEAKLRKDAEGANNNKTIFIGLGILALATIIYFVTKKKK
jgi:hypothetical protein